LGWEGRRETACLEQVCRSGVCLDPALGLFRVVFPCVREQRLFQIFLVAREEGREGGKEGGREGKRK
jgi:hypothetical protein